MTKQELQKLKGVWVGLSAFYGKDLTDEQLVLQTTSLEEYPFDKVMTAILRYKNDVKNPRPPVPAQIIALINPVISEDDQARLIAGAIVGAIGKFGWCNPKEAKEYIGPIGWSVVNRVGGWESVCEMSNSGSITALYAQWRDLCLSSIKMEDTKEQRVAIDGPRQHRGELGMAALVEGIKDGIQKRISGEGKPVRTEEGGT